MKLTRRNALIGLGSLVAGSGALVGTGAFSSVEADRTVSINTAGDAGGFLTLTGDGEYVTDDTTGDQLTFDLGQVGSTNAFNNEAKTVVEGVVTVTNNAADSEDITVGFEDSGSPTASTTLNIGDSDPSGSAVAKVTLYFGTEGSQATQTISSGSDAKIGVIVNTNTGSNGDGSDGTSADVTLYADGS
ncbi:MAG: hypothetical protein ACI9CA_000338 [Natronomonas sp.]|jgi:hypothetical protein